MNPAIKRYLEEHAATYTPEALREGLLDAGYDPAEVDAALSGWDAQRVASGRSADDRRRFGTWAILLHLGVLVAVFVLIVALKGTSSVGTALLGCAVLSLFLLIGWAISSLIGRTLVPATGVGVALLAPAITAVVLGGSCFALLSSAIGTPPRDGTVDLEILAPRAFEGSGSASCYVDGGSAGVQVNSEPLGTLDGKAVSVYLSWYGDDPNNPAPASSTSISVLLDATAEGQVPESFGVIVSTSLDVDAAPDALTGTLRFEGLASEPLEGPGEQPTPEEISGSVSWNCE